jgi:C1A family cysteine protease
MVTNSTKKIMRVTNLSYSHLGIIMPIRLKTHSTINRGYGWKRGLPDQRKPFCNITFAGDLPSKVDLRDKCPAVYDQGDLGSCTANALAGLSEFLMIKQGLTPYVPSRLFIYYNERAIEGSISDDAGASLSDGASVMGTFGAPHESLWWYNTAKFKTKPNKSVYTDGAKHRLHEVTRVQQNLDAFRKVLASGVPFVGGFTVYSSFESPSVAANGIVSMPSVDEDVLGGHAILIVGYDDVARHFIVRNSWGSGWGDKGYFYMPYDYLLSSDLADDFWTASKID